MEMIGALAGLGGAGMMLLFAHMSYHYIYKGETE